MVRSGWVGVAFVCGIALGVVGARITSGDRKSPLEAAPAATDAAPIIASATTRVPAAPAAKSFEATDSSITAARDTRDPGVKPAAVEMPLITPTSATPDVGPIKPIEVGAAFHQMVDRPSMPGFPNEFGDAHRALERETRDDSWAWQMEADMQNSLTAYVSVGDLQVRHLECRTTICELRLFASDAHAEAMNTWQETMQAQPWLRRVEMVGGSFSVVAGGSEGLMIFRTPKK